MGLRLRGKKMIFHSFLKNQAKIWKLSLSKSSKRLIRINIRIQLISPKADPDPGTN